MGTHKKSENLTEHKKTVKKDRVIKGRPRSLDTWTVELLRDRAGNYFDKCDARTRQVVTRKGDLLEVSNPAPYTVAGLCSYLRILKADFEKWMRQPDDFGREAQMVMQRIVDNRETGASDNTQNAGFNQFILKNYAPEQFRDKVEVENTISGETAKMFQAWSEQWKQI